MAALTSKHSRDVPQDFESLLNNLQDWELSLKEKDKKQRLDAVGKGNMDRSAKPSSSASLFSENDRVKGKQTTDKTTPSDKRSSVRQYDYLKECEALSQLSSGVPSQEGIFDANSEKELGNEFYKQKKFNEAVDCYSRSIAFSPSAVAYANRAMAFIKIKRFQEAENDCTEALNLDDRYIKAYSRRSTARKELGKLKEAIDDAEFALRLEPQNQDIKKQCAEYKSLLKKSFFDKQSSLNTEVASFDKDLLKKASVALRGSMERAPPGKSEVDKRKNMQQVQPISTSPPEGRVVEILGDHSKGTDIREVVADDKSLEIKRKSTRSNGFDADSVRKTAIAKMIPKYCKQELGPSLQELAAKAAGHAKAEAAKNIVPPNSAYQFEMSWRGLSGDRDLQARLLKVTSPAALPGIFKNALSAPILVDIVRCIATFFMEDMTLGVEYLQNLTKISRFDMIIMCLSSADKADISKIWNEVFSKGTTDYAAIVSNLRSRYGVKQQ